MVQAQVWRPIQKSDQNSSEEPNLWRPAQDYVFLIRIHFFIWMAQSQKYLILSTVSIKKKKRDKLGEEKTITKVVNRSEDWREF